MRAWIMALIMALAMLLAGASVQAAPTCVDKNGNTLRCNTSQAMPVGWQPSPQALLERELSLPPNPSVNTLLKIALGLAAIFVLIALLPNFDGDWEQNRKDDNAER